MIAAVISIRAFFISAYVFLRKYNYLESIYQQIAIGIFSRSGYATNFYNYETLVCVAKAAQAMNAPVMLQLTRSSIDYMGLHTAYRMGRQVIADYGLQGYIHLDHGPSLELVLHGSSGIPHDQVREAIANGIVKVNLATEIKDNFMRALKQVLSESDEIDLRKVFPKAMLPVVELLKEKYAVTGARV